MVGYIYSIINNKTKERYVGQTIDLGRRKKEHIKDLESNKHLNKKLQSAWNKYGKNNFSFEYQKYDLANKDELNILEKAFIQQYDSYYNGYNLTLGGDGGNTLGNLSFENYCLIYIGCRWKGMTEKIAKVLNIDSSTVSAILREKTYLWYKEKADRLTKEEKKEIQDKFDTIFNTKGKIADKNRIPTHLTEDDYFYCLCIASSYSRGIETALSKFFDKHKSFLANGIKGKTSGKAYSALQRYKMLSKEEIVQIGKQKFEEWEIQKYSNVKLNIIWNDRWRN